jgi:hypothetical protein
MNRTRVVRRSLLFVLFAGLAACRIANESEAGADAGSGGGAAAACATDTECAGACPAGSVGCACVASPTGLVCAPTCVQPRDCPLGTVCGLGGICVPGGSGEGDGGLPDWRDAAPPHEDASPHPVEDAGAPGPKPCQGDGECAGACPQGTLGCTCHPGPQGTICVPTCNVAEDGPPNPGGAPLVCNAGVCVPEQKP